MERGREKRTLPDGDDPTVILAEHGDFLTRLIHPGRADEHRVERRAAADPAVQPQADRTLEGVHLTAEGVAPGGHVDAAEGLLARDAVVQAVGEHDQPRTRAEGGQAVGDERAYRGEQVE